MHKLEVGFQILKFHEGSGEFSVNWVVNSSKCNRTFNFSSLRKEKAIALLAPPMCASLGGEMREEHSFFQGKTFIFSLLIDLGG